MDQECSPPRTEHKASGKAMAPHIPNEKVQDSHAHTHAPPHRHTHTIILNMYTSSSVGPIPHKIFKIQMSYAFNMTSFIK